MLTDFHFFFTVGLSSDCVMKWSLKIPSHVATLPCETLTFKNWSKSTLINISCSLSVISLKTGLLYLQASEAVWLYMRRYHIISFDIFCWSFIIYRYLFCELYLPWHSVHYSLLPVQKCKICKNVRYLYELPDFCPLNSPDLWPQYIYFKIRGSESTRKAQGVHDVRQNLIYAWVGVEQSVIDNGIDQWRRRLHACIRATGGHS